MVLELLVSVFGYSRKVAVHPMSICSQSMTKSIGASLVALLRELCAQMNSLVLIVSHHVLLKCVGTSLILLHSLYRSTLCGRADLVVVDLSEETIHHF